MSIVERYPGRVLIGAIVAAGAIYFPALELIRAPPAPPWSQNVPAILLRDTTPPSGVGVPGDRDCAVCPELARIPPGRIRVGVAPSESAPGHGALSPVFAHIAPFRMGRYEVTFDELDACVADGGCVHRPSDLGWGRGWRPAILVSWNDAQEYLAWLSRRTGKRYRLPTDLEWRHAANFEARGAYPSVAADLRDPANCIDCENPWGGWATWPVGRFKPNRLGLFDLRGNVWEWVEDCLSWRTRSGRLRVDCAQRMARGGGWKSFRPGLGPLDAQANRREERFVDCGFRVARDED